MTYKALYNQLIKINQCLKTLNRKKSMQNSIDSKRQTVTSMSEHGERIIQKNIRKTANSFLPQSRRQRSNLPSIPFFSKVFLTLLYLDLADNHPAYSYMMLKELWGN